MTLFRAIALIAMCITGLAAQAQPTAPLKVTGGEIAGAHADAVNTYFGIPYAAPPVGKLRWRAPQPVMPWKGVRQATSFSPACAQTAVWITDPKSEDCLYLNVWAPEKAEKLPVLVWIHGGGYYGGTGSQPGFNGANLAKRGAIVVTINYRLGIFGFFAHPELKEDSGNQGLRDQIAALRWVKDNIAAFGGDASRVTIFGESAGGISVGILMASPMAKGLFQRAIAESGNAGWPMNADEYSAYEQKRVEATGVALARTVGAKNLAALRAMSVETLHKQPWSARVSVDGRVLREDQTSLYRNHRQNDVPLLVGWNAEEGKDLAPEILNTSEFTAARYKELVTKLLGHAPSDDLLAAYPAATDAQAKASIDQLTTDWWGWRKVYWAGLQAKYGQSRAYVYYFTHRPAEPVTPCGYGCGAGHGAEIRYVFDNLDQDHRQWSAADRQLAARLADTWVQFARTGSLPDWPAYDGSNASIVRIGDGKDKLPDFSLFQ
ncbi:para-nitrobenzyl esterase [Duganella sp. SG902]|uniref:carboxylesterase/lipase family protein n=1 Tax=Duganella sp. SG902 TaxID=2587016 RepID=UPI00159DC286|nr:carboxylesterase family protein [Duganella sp. SG902]NVM77205.1 para-nitrobenzyl esterase [Duganella sp. SG902]